MLLKKNVSFILLLYLFYFIILYIFCYCNKETMLQEYQCQKILNVNNVSKYCRSFIFSTLISTELEKRHATNNFCPQDILLIFK